MADLKFVTGTTRSGRDFLACSQACIVATFENDVPSVSLLVKDTTANVGVRVVAAKAVDGVVIALTAADGLDTPTTWSLTSYTLTPDTDEESLTISGLPDNLSGIVVEEV